VAPQVGDAALAKQDVGGVVEVEVVHGGALGEVVGKVMAVEIKKERTAR
jgi:hypothetical protein